MIKHINALSVKCKITFMRKKGCKTENFIKLVENAKKPPENMSKRRRKCKSVVLETTPTPDGNCGSGDRMSSAPTCPSASVCTCLLLNYHQNACLPLRFFHSSKFQPSKCGLKLSIKLQVEEYFRIVLKFVSKIFF